MNSHPYGNPVGIPIPTATLPGDRRICSYYPKFVLTVFVLTRFDCNFLENICTEYLPNKLSFMQNANAIAALWFL